VRPSGKVLSHFNIADFSYSKALFSSTEINQRQEKLPSFSISPIVQYRFDMGQSWVVDFFLFHASCGAIHQWESELLSKQGEKN
jgi:hypothetical protein